MKFYGIFIPVPVPENWIGISHSRSRYREWTTMSGISRSPGAFSKVIVHIEDDLEDQEEAGADVDAYLDDAADEEGEVELDEDIE